MNRITADLKRRTKLAVVNGAGQQSVGSIAAILYYSRSLRLMVQYISPKQASRHEAFCPSAKSTALAIRCTPQTEESDTEWVRKIILYEEKKKKNKKKPTTTTTNRMKFKNLSIYISATVYRSYRKTNLYFNIYYINRLLSYISYSYIYIDIACSLGPAETQCNTINFRFFLSTVCYNI